MESATRRPGRLVEWLWVLVLGGGAAYLLAYCAIGVVRILYPYHLEWMEGGSLHQVQWILAGHPLYVRPSIEFTPFTYPPLYFYVSAAAAFVFGNGLPPLRLVSFLASLGCFGILFQHVRRETTSAAAGFFAAALFAATFKIGGAWFDLARVDSLFLVLLLAGIYYVRFGSSNGSAIAAAALLTLSYLTKQTALTVIPAIALGSLILRPRWALRFLPALAAFGGLSTLLLDRLHPEWFRFYVFELPAGLHFLGLPVLKFLRQDVLKSLWIALAVGLAGLVSLAWRRERRRAALFYLLLGIGTFAAAYLGRNKVGGFLNALHPAYAFLALLAGIAAGEMRAWLERPAAGEGAGRPVRRQVLAAGLSLACLGQLALLFYDPRSHLPSRSDRRAGDDLVRLLRSFEGEVFLPEFGYLGSLAGKPLQAHSIATWDVMRSKHQKLGLEVWNEMRTAVREGRYAAIVFAHEDWDDPSQLGEDLQGYKQSRIVYRLIEEPREGTFLDRGVRWEVRAGAAGADEPSYGTDQDVFLPLVGYQVRPVLLYTLER